MRQAGVGSARAAGLDRKRVRVQANDAHALVRLHAGGGHLFEERTQNLGIIINETFFTFDLITIYQ